MADTYPGEHAYPELAAAAYWPTEERALTIDLPTVLNLVTTAAIVVGVAFGLIELRQALRGRRDYAAADIVRTIQTQEIRRAARRCFQLPEDADPDLVNSDPQMLEAALAMDSACEMWGSLVYEGVVDPHMLDRMVGGWVRGLWRRLRRWVESERAVTGSPNVAEWWQWLYELLEADPDPGKALGAYVSYRGQRR